MVQNGSKVLIATQNNDDLDAIAILYEETYCRGDEPSPKPVRASAASLSGLFDLQEGSEQPGDCDPETPEHLTLLKTFLEMKHEFTIRRRLLADLSVEQAVIDYVTGVSTASEKLRGQYVMKNENNEDVPDGKPVDIRAEFAS